MELASSIVGELIGELVGEKVDKVWLSAVLPGSAHVFGMADTTTNGRQN